MSAGSLRQEPCWRIRDRWPETEELSQAWERLVARQRLPSVFMDWDWLTCWWRHFGSRRRLLLVTAESEDELLAAAPFMVSTRPLLPLRPARILELVGTGRVPANGQGLADRMDLLCHPDRPELVAELLARVLEAPPSFDLIRLASVPSSSPTVRAMEQLARERGYSVCQRLKSLSPYAVFEGGWDEFLTGRKSKTRRQLRNSRRRLQELADVIIRTYPDDGGSLEQTLAAIRAVSRESYKWRDGTALFQPPVVRRFLSDYFARMDARSRLMVQLLDVAGRTAAFQAGFRQHQRWFAYTTAYQEKLARHHLGIHLLLHSLEGAFQAGALELDMMAGEETYKRHWSNAAREEVELLAVAPRSPLARVAHILHFRWRRALSQRRLPKRIHNRLLALRYGRGSPGSGRD
jgi:CelD/BcsL family acetyltransferase involved in cellulose biosynthesis